MQPINCEINEVINKFQSEEKNLEEQLKKCKIESEKNNHLNLQRIQTPKRLLYINNEEAWNRNQKLLKKLEMSRARLRTLTSFTPTDQEFRERAAFYRKFLDSNC
ncbi:Protein of unknown function [Cotesia congregata]|uniref:Uncharacterized protein n=1 Tax=Cotesia congregata TaxID=51543 RepID=A0A8J2HAE1_COTCN|nr:Protein of unknown function [Cotesia congregata]